MSEKKPDFKAAMEALAEGEKAKLQPLSPEELAAIHEKGVDALEGKGLSDRLALDKAAVKTLLELDTFPHGHYPEMSEEALDASWREFRHKLEAPSRASTANETAVLPTVPVDPGWFRTVAGLAAVFLFTTVGLAFWVFQLKRTGPGTEMVTMDAAISDIYPDRVRNAAAEIMLTQRVQTLRFHLSEQWRSFSLFRLEIRDAGDRRVLSVEGRADDQNALTIILTRTSFAKPGTYRAMVFGLVNQTATPLSGFALTVPEG